MLKAIAEEFRKSFEELDFEKAPGFLVKFPEGCCSWASYMIGHFLKYERGFNPIEIQAERDDPNGMDPHSWLAVEDIIIDITSDEFEDSGSKVIVTNYSEWHDTWKIVNKAEIVEINTYDQIPFGTELKPSEIYELLVERVRKKCT
jgi:hypothetical protein